MVQKDCTGWGWPQAIQSQATLALGMRFPFSVMPSLSLLPLSSLFFLLNWYSCLRASQSLPANTGDLKRTQVRSLGQEDPLQEGTATQSSILAWEIPWTEEVDGLQSIGWQGVRHSWSDLACTHAHSCLKILITQYLSCEALSYPATHSKRTNLPLLCYF